MNEIFIKPIVKIALDYVVKKIPAAKDKLEIDALQLEDSIAHHIKFVNNWSSFIGFRELRGPKQLNCTFFDLNLSLSIKKHIYDEEPIEKIRVSQLMDIPGHMILLGDPGAGKTTTTKYLCQTFFKEECETSNGFTFPLLIRLRELKSEGIYERLSNILGLRIHFPEDEKLPPSYKKLMGKRIVSTYLDELKPIVFLDGFDEVPSGKKSEIIEEFRELVLNASNFKVILTCRSGEFDQYIDNSTILELLPLLEKEISYFVHLWLKDKKKKKDFMSQLLGKPYLDAAIRPLTLSHLCAIYERTGYIPHRPKTVYQKIINMLLQDWDEERGLNRKSIYSNFDKERKSEFLASFALNLTTRFGAAVFSKDQFSWAFLEINREFELPDDEGSEVVKEIESHTGLIIKSGVNKFEFAHKSLQEYLCADFIVRLPRVPNDPKFIKILPNEIAIAVSLSSHPSEYLSEFILNNLSQQKIDESFFIPFLNRLVLERPQFKPYFVLGISALQFFSISIFPNGSGSDFSNYDKTKMTSIMRIFELPNIKESFETLGNIFRAEKIFRIPSKDEETKTRFCILGKTQENQDSFAFTIPTEVIVPAKIIENKLLKIDNYDDLITKYPSFQKRN